MALTGGVQVPPPTRRKPLFDSGFRRVCGRVEKVLKENPSQVEEYKGGKEKVLGFLVGQVMKASEGKANPVAVNKLLKEKLSRM